MGILDSIKRRMPGGSMRAYDEDDYQEYDEFEDDSYDGNGTAGEYEDSPDDDSGYQDTNALNEEANGAFGRTYRTETHTPIISLSDVRSQGLPPYDPARTTKLRGTVHPRSERNTIGNGAGQATAGIDYGMRQTEAMYTSPYTDDTPRLSANILMRPGLQSLSELHEERQRIEQVPGRPAAYGGGSVVSDRVSAVPARNAASTAPNSLVTARGTMTPTMSRPGMPATRAAGPATSAARRSSGTSLSSHSGYQSRGRQPFRELVVLRPVTYADAEQVSKALSTGSAVAIDLSQIKAELAKRILDFSFGVAAALEAQVMSPANRIYVITRDYELTSEERELLVARGVLK